MDVGFSDILENLDFGIMGTLEARNGRWSIFGDAIYLNVASDDDATAGPGIPVSVAAEVEGFVFTTGVGYDFAQTNSSRLNGFAGLRYLDMDTGVNLAVAGGSSRVNDKFSNWDGIIGLRGQSALSPDWDLLYYADVGTGDSDLTWQVALAMDYKFDAWTLTFGYRHLDWSGLNDSATLEDLNFSGPFVGAKFNF
ncbi:MAG: hypothetical protein ABJX32_08160 [Tateyamaria sp.]|uniref:hypothetical protein n=1 Tax=Tateyamaria sp. TaxID=1929288 RepID=UPI00329A8C88